MVTGSKAGTIIIGGKMMTGGKAGRSGLNMWRIRQNTNNSRAQEIKIESGRAKAGQSPHGRVFKRADGAALKKMPSSKCRGMIRLKRPLRST